MRKKIVKIGQQSTLTYQKKIQKNLSNLLKDSRAKEGMTATKLADCIGLEKSKYCKLESSTEPYSRFVRSYDFLNNLAHIMEINFSDLVHYLENGSFPPAKHGHRDLYQWEVDLLRIFSGVSCVSRNKFIGSFKKNKGTARKALRPFLEFFSESHLFTEFSDITEKLTSIAKKFEK